MNSMALLPWSALTRGLPMMESPAETSSTSAPAASKSFFSWATPAMPKEAPSSSRSAPWVSLVWRITTLPSTSGMT